MVTQNSNQSGNIANGNGERKALAVSAHCWRDTESGGCDWFTLEVLSAMGLEFISGIPLAWIKDPSSALT